MANRTILIGMTATFVGLTALLVVAGVVVNPLLLVVAVPFGIAAYLMWYHASGRLRERTRREADRLGATERERARQRARTAENRRDAYRTARGSRASAGRRRNDTPGDRAPAASVMSEREAYATLELDPAADQEAIRTTYRERAKRLHPDGDEGDEEAFKRLNRAYEVLKE